MLVGCWLSVIEKKKTEKEEARGDGFYSAKLVKRKRGRGMVSVRGRKRAKNLRGTKIS
jgi:hypothetical protein